MKQKIKKPKFSLDNIQHTKVHDSSKFKDFNVNEFFENENDVAAALLQCLIDNDSESFMEILDSYLRVNRSKIAQKTKLSRATVSSAFSKKSNPTLKTIAKIVHEAHLSKK